MDRNGSTSIEKAYQYFVWLVPVLEKLPRSQKFLIGDRIQSAATDVLELLTEAIYSKERAPLLKTAQLRLERQRILIRALFDLQFLDVRRYEHAARELNEIGRMVGGWMKAHIASQKRSDRVEAI